MGVVFRQSIKTSLVVVLGAVLGALTIWLSTKYIPDKQQFGFTKTLANQAATIAQFLVFGLNLTLLVFQHRFANDKKKKDLLFTFCFLMPFLFAVLFTLVYYFIRGWFLALFQNPSDAELMNKYFMWLPIYTLFLIYMVVLEQYLASQMKVAISAFMREIVLRLVNIVLLLAFAFNYISFHTLVIGSVLIYLIPVIVFIFLTIKTKNFGLSFNFYNFSKTDYTEIFHFAWFHFLLTVAIVLTSSMDILLLPFYDKNGLSSVAIYSVAVFIISFLQIPFKAMAPASYSVIAKAFANNEIAQAKDYFVRASLNTLIPTIVFAVIICCNLQNAVRIINNHYDEIIPVFLILLLGRMVDLATGMNDQILSVTNYYRFNFYLSLILIATLYGLLRFLIPLDNPWFGGVRGAAWSTTITIIVFNAIKYVYIWKKLDMQPFSKSTFWVAISGAAAFIPGLLLPYIYNPFLDAVIRSLLIAFVYLLMLLWLKPSPDLILFMDNIKKNKRLF